MAKRLLPLLAIASVLAGCVGAPAANPVDPEDLDDGVAVEDGKADDFLSLTAREFRVSGTARVTLESNFANQTEAHRLARVNELIAMKQIEVAYFLTSYLIEKEKGDANLGFGGQGGLSKVGDYDQSHVHAIDNLTYEFNYSQVIAGHTNLMALLHPTRRNGKNYITVTMGTPSNEELAELETDAQWFRQPPWKDWNPSRVDAAQKVDVELEIAPEPASSDAWFDYNALFDDGRLTIDVHFGYDYHNAYHRKHPRKLFYWLRDDMGFTAPVATFDDLSRSSGAFTKTINVNGQDAIIEIRIFYPKDGPATDPDTDAGGRQLEADVRDSLAHSDVIAWSGHSGPFYGFALANWKRTSEGDLSYEELASVRMPANHYQIVYADGCDTYHMGEAFRQNPNKPDGALLDVITSTTFADGDYPYTTMNFISHLVEQDSRGHHRPRTLTRLLADLRLAVYSDAMYGIHGTDDNPHLHPYANTDLMCQSCTSTTQCGDGSVCATIGRSGRHCVPACTATDACPADSQCRPIASSSSRAIYTSACVPDNFRCE